MKLLAAIAVLVLAGGVPAALNFTMNSINGKSIDLSKYQGRVVLMVNVASQCGFTPQYEGLQDLHKKYAAKGLSILGFPSNDFGAQEPGTNTEIADFCSTTYNVKFPMFSKISVAGDDKHALYKELTAAQPAATGEGSMRDRLKNYGMSPNPVPEVVWNFEKFLINRNGDVVGRFAPDVAPDDPRLLGAIDAELAKA